MEWVLTEQNLLRAFRTYQKQPAPDRSRNRCTASSGTASRSTPWT